MENDNNNNVKRSKRKTDHLVLPKKNLEDTWAQASLQKGQSPARPSKQQKLRWTSPHSSEEEVSVGSLDPYIDDGGNHGVTTELPVQIIAAKPMQLLTEIKYKDVEMLVHSAKEMLANKQQIRPIWGYFSQRAQDQLTMRVQARKSNVNPPEVVHVNLPDMTPDQLLQLVQLLWPASLTMLNSASSLIVGELRSLILIHANYNAWEKAWLTIRETVRKNHLPQEEENAIMTLVVKAIRENHPREGKHYVEATQIINKLVADKVHHEIDTFFAGLFHQLMENNALYRSALDKGLMPAFSHPERAKPEAEKYKGPKPAATGKEPTVCNACGRTGHMHAKCNFVRAKHPDINPDPTIPFAVSPCPYKKKSAYKEVICAYNSVSGDTSAA